MTDVAEVLPLGLGSPHALYRYFDASDTLLYVGISGALAVRERVHIDSSKWMQLTASSTIKRYETSEELRKAERQAIKAEHPVFNKQHNDTAAAKKRLRAYLERIGRLDLLEPGPRMINHPVREAGDLVPPGTGPRLSAEDEARKAAWLAGEWVELFPGGPRHRRKAAVPLKSFF